MNGEMLPEKIEKLESVFLNILYSKPDERLVAPNLGILGDIKSALNSLFDDNLCLDVIYTLNTDKPFFGIRINPAMSPSDATVILITEERVKLNKYQLELDSKLFDIGLDESELAAIIVYHVAAMMDSYELFDELRAQIDRTVVSNEDIINIRESVNYSQLVIFALKDTMHKLTSIFYKDDEDEYLLNPVIQACELVSDLATAKEKIGSYIASLESFRPGKVVILQWMFIMIRDMTRNSGIIMDTLTDAKSFTASKLEIQEIDKTIYSIDRIDSSIAVSESESINKFFDRKHVSALNEISLFRNLKKSGLRAIEDELYEYTMRVKNCTDADDAYLIMRGINSRISILQDYLDNEDIKESEYRKWESVMYKWMDLRIALSKKKFKDKNYGLFYDYNQLPSDKDGKNNEED